MLNIGWAGGSEQSCRSSTSGGPSWVGLHWSGCLLDVSLGRCFRQVQLQRDPRAEPEHGGGIISHLARESLGILLEELVEVTREMTVWASLLKLIPHELDLHNWRKMKCMLDGSGPFCVKFPHSRAIPVRLIAYMCKSECTWLIVCVSPVVNLYPVVPHSSCHRL